MRNIDLTPFYRSTIGFDRLASVLDSLTQAEQNQSAYPPYNIELMGEDAYRITMAVAGFSEADIDIQIDQNKLTVIGSKAGEKSAGQFLHQGIAERNFERRFQLADYVRVEGASLNNGLLHVDLVREIPDAMKPRKISINRKDPSLKVA
ncbi:Hsp20 family protein [Simiduia sp. 21SJ11W-1]|uniref:Hsp20 family protein n=1 Tax=Simiduia sp. 21SJ11W-1 TaxID=2909669 RepID=UPI00209D29B4|nr:Hsp20 family protein [Simiduia sp. 21SJ11W-1]UTA49269.1 Hsp20 family protein [Simiduia sp. 21SJ11W-1]